MGNYWEKIGLISLGMGNIMKENKLTKHKFVHNEYSDAQCPGKYSKPCVVQCKCYNLANNLIEFAGLDTK